MSEKFPIISVNPAIQAAFEKGYKEHKEYEERQKVLCEATVAGWIKNDLPKRIEIAARDGRTHFSVDTSETFAKEKLQAIANISGLDVDWSIDSGDMRSKVSWKLAFPTA